MARVLSERGQRMLGYLPPFEQEDPDTQAIIHAQATELDTFEVAMDELIENFFVTTAEKYLHIWERHLGLSVNPPDKTLEQRRTSVISFYRMLRKSPAGSNWEARLTDLIGDSWAYVEDNPRSIRSRWLEVFDHVPTESNWVYVQGNSGMWLQNPDVGGIQFASGGTLRVRDTDSQFDSQETIMSFVAGTAGAAPILAAVAKDNAYGMAYARVNNGNLEAMTYNGSAHTVRATIAAALTVGTRYWLVARVNGNALTAELWQADPSHPGSAPWKTAGPYTLAGADATNLGTTTLGYGGIFASAMVQDWVVERLWLNEVGFTLPDYTLRITIPFAPESAKAQEVLEMLATKTPAELDIQVFFDEGFILGYSHLGNEGF